MKITILGNCANQTANRECVNFVVSYADKNILVDAGPGVVRQLYKSDFSCSDIDAIIITHSHGDHVLGYPYVIFGHFYDRLNGNIGPDKVEIFGTKEICDGLDSMLRFCYVPENYPFSINYNYLSSECLEDFEFKSFKISTAPVDHTTPTLGLRLAANNKVLAYSSDTLYSKAVVKLSKEADLLIHEGFVTTEQEELAYKVKHATAKMAGMTATEANVKSLALVHMFPPFIGRENDLIDEAKRFFNGEVFVPEELSKFEL